MSTPGRTLLPYTTLFRSAKLNETIKSAVQAKELDFKSLLSQKELEIAKLQEQMAGIAQVKEADFNKELGKKEAEIARLNEQIKTEVQAKEIALNTQISQKDMEIIRLQEEINSIAHKKQIDFNKEMALKDQEITRLNEQMGNMIQNKQLEITAELAKKDQEIQNLKSTIEQSGKMTEIAVLKEKNLSQEALQAKEREVLELKSKVDAEKNQATIRESNIKEQHQLTINQLNEQIGYYKDLKAKMSTKMVGETLELHCSTEFNRVRTMMYPNAYFEKDNDAQGGFKGDFIFRDYMDGTEYVSIMFEMKNEMDTTATKHKNEDFFAKLDKDRIAKGCEYAVLASHLESESVF